MKPCRDCSKPTPSSARSCPHCGILNPVVQWVALPDGSHLTRREMPDPVAAAAALSARPTPAAAARAMAPIVPRASHEPAAARPVMAAPQPTGEEANAIRQCSTAFYWLAGLNAVAGMFLGSVFLIEAAIMGGLSFGLRKYNSRIAAVLLVLYSLLTFASKVMTALDSGGFRFGWIWLWIVVTGAAFKAAAATFKLQGRQGAVALA